MIGTRVGGSLMLLGLAAGFCGCRASGRCCEAEGSSGATGPRVAFDVGRDAESWGSIVFELAPREAPETAANFLRYVEDGYYDGTIIHRVLIGEHQRIQIFQGGGYTALRSEAKPGQRAPIPLETRGGLSNIRGTIAMARDAAPDTATSEYFINLGDNTRLDYQDEQKPGYAVFGRIVSGWEVVARIMQVQTEENPDPVLKGEVSTPLKPPVVLRARRVEQ